MSIRNTKEESRVTILTMGKPNGQELILKTGPSLDSLDYHQTTIGKAISILPRSSQAELNGGFLAVELSEIDEVNSLLTTISPLLYLPVKSGREIQILELLEIVEKSKSILPKVAAQHQTLIHQLFHQVDKIVAPIALIPYPNE